MQEVKDLDANIKLAKAPKTLEDGWQAMVNELKEFNLETEEEPCPTYVSTMLTPKKEEEYFKLFSQ